MPWRLATAGITRQEQSLIQSAVSLYLSGSGWQFSHDPDDADVVIVGPQLQDPGSVARNAVHVRVTDGPCERDETQLHRPVRYRELLRTLRALSSGEAVTPDRSGAPCDTVLALVHRAIDAGGIHYIDHEAFAPVRIDADAGVYSVFGSRQLPVTYFREPAGRFTASVRHRQEAAGAWSEPRRLDGLRWTAALHAGGGTLLPPLNPDSVVGLIRWPDFSRLAHAPVHMRLAAYLHRRPAALGDVARETGHGKAEVADFINAARELDLVRIEAEPGRRASGGNRQPLGLVSRIRMRLSALSDEHRGECP